MSVPEGRFAPIRTLIGSGPENATMQLLHQTWRSRIDRLNVSGVIAGSPGKYGNQQRFSASTSSDTSSVRQKRYDDTIEFTVPEPWRKPGRSVPCVVAGLVRHVQRAHLVEVTAADSRDDLSLPLGVRDVLVLGFLNLVRMRM